MIDQAVQPSVDRIVCTPVLRGALVERCGYTCTYCKRQSASLTTGPDGETWHIDHVMPLALGGSNDERNLTLSCAECNRKKGSAHPDSDWRDRTAPTAKEGRELSEDQVLYEAWRDRDKKMRRALSTLVEIDKQRTNPGVCGLAGIVSFGSLGAGSNYAVQPIYPRHIWEGSVKGVRVKSRNFEWHVSVDELERLLVEHSGFSLEELRAELAASV